MCTSDAASRWAVWALANPKFGSSINPKTARRQIMPTNADHITTSPPGFENPAASLTVLKKSIPH